MKTMVFFLEEPSAREMLKGILPGILPESVHPVYLVFQGKQDLEKNLQRKLRGWQKPDSIFVVLRDQDSGDCRLVKSNLVDICCSSGRENVLVRIACRELESFYLGDLSAVEQGLGLTSLSVKQNERKYRNPDKLGSPSGELFRLSGKTYQKVAGSRAIAPHLDIRNNCSHSFNILISGILRLLTD